MNKTCKFNPEGTCGSIWPEVVPIFFCCSWHQNGIKKFVNRVVSKNDLIIVVLSAYFGEFFQKGRKNQETKKNLFSKSSCLLLQSFRVTQKTGGILAGVRPPLKGGPKLAPTKIPSCDGGGSSLGK